MDKITDTNGNVVEEIGTNIRRQVISESTSDVIRQMMEYEVGNGTGGGKNAYVSGYRIGGKSGTSEQLNMHRRADGDYKKVASFAAVLPADDPEILVYVMLDDPNNARTDYSSILAAPVAGNIISEVAPYLGIATDGEDRSQTTVTVPNLISTEWSNAQVQLNIKGLKHQLMESASDQTAALVTCQYPHAGAKVPYGTTVYLYTDTYDGSLTEVPDVSGKSADFARQMLAAAGLNCVVEGDANGVVQSQSSEVGGQRPARYHRYHYLWIKEPGKTRGERTMEKIHASKLLAGLVPAGFLTSDPEVELVTTDSREVCPGCIFVAFPGERFDGHDFAAKALEEGAVFVVVNHPVEGVPAGKSHPLPGQLPRHDGDGCQLPQPVPPQGGGRDRQRGKDHHQADDLRGLVRLW